MDEELLKPLRDEIEALRRRVESLEIKAGGTDDAAGIEVSNVDLESRVLRLEHQTRYALEVDEDGSTVTLNVLADRLG